MEFFGSLVHGLPVSERSFGFRPYLFTRANDRPPTRPQWVGGAHVAAIGNEAYGDIFGRRGVKLPEGNKDNEQRWGLGVRACMLTTAV